ncbi:hypothetical protein [Nocardioides rotundus]
MEPGAEHREERSGALLLGQLLLAAMEPGAEHREERAISTATQTALDAPQWSPALSTGKSTTAAGAWTCGRGRNGARR